jgi:hypothetical protein
LEFYCSDVFIKLLLFSFLSAFYEKCTLLLEFTSMIFYSLFFLSLVFDLPPHSTPADPSRHTSVPRHTGWKSPVHVLRRPLVGLLHQPWIIVGDACEPVGGMRIGKGNRSTWRKPTPMSLCPPQIPRELTPDRTKAAVMGSWRLTVGVNGASWLHCYYCRILTRLP